MVLWRKEEAWLPLGIGRLKNKEMRRKRIWENVYWWWSICRRILWTEAWGVRKPFPLSLAVGKKARDFDGTVLFTRDTHGEDYMETQEGKYLPVAHCIRGTEGWD